MTAQSWSPGEPRNDLPWSLTLLLGCVLGVLFAAVLSVGMDVVCRWHEGEPGGPSYCQEGWR
ncbi:MAG TPA: hypothetical protein VNT51_06600 [Miltoncostaeaceae bacterium]|nr:hypothetical protein [Miltoncostaeaceae bacterium]